jgi:hypothetical protein
VSNGRTIDEGRIGKDSIGDGNGLLEILSRNLPEFPEENHAKPHSV